MRCTRDALTFVAFASGVPDLAALVSPRRLCLSVDPHLCHLSPLRLLQAKAHGLVKVGDTVVVSQCPRHTDSSVMQEAGVVKLVTVTEQALP